MVNPNNKIRVAVMMGGFSSERPISLSTGKQIIESLDKEKYDVVGVDAAIIPGSTLTTLQTSPDEVKALTKAGSALINSTKLFSLQELASGSIGLRPNVVFLALHGKYGEDGTVQGLLELLGISYTGSGVLASALAMDKSMTKRILANEGIKVPESVDFLCKLGQWNEDQVADAVKEIGYPVIVKPSRQGSSIGMTKVLSPSALNKAIRQAANYDSQIVVEQFLVGAELTVSVLGNDDPFALPVVEIVPKKGFYDYEAKYKPGATEEIVPARISKTEAAVAQKIALRAHRALRCRGVSRTDLIATDHGMYALEVNTIPGMTPTSLLPRAAEAAGIPFAELLDMIIDYALEEGTDK
ncbi:MAG: D-alanine--D-alanine ligase [Armatimonadetes bacterium]|nr:D-alanine--D-alanine ligase [Armatimonadota bacterium]